MMSAVALERLTLDITIHQAKDVVGKDRNVLLQRSTSDPYVQVWLSGQKIGQTKVVKKTLAPVWNESFSVTYTGPEMDRLYQLQAPVLKFVLLDHDVIGRDDPMGVVEVPLRLPASDNNRPNANHPHLQQQPVWYPITTGSGKDCCADASGQLLVQIIVKAKPVQQLQLGNAFSLHGISHLKVGLAWDTATNNRTKPGTELDLDVACVAMSNKGQIVLSDTIYYGNLRNANKSLVHSGDERTGETAGDDEYIQVDVTRVPAQLQALYILLSVVTPNQLLDTIHNCRVNITNAQTKQVLCQFTPTSHDTFTTMYVARLAREHSANNNQWILRPMHGGDPTARDFGRVIPQLKAMSRDIMPKIYVDPHERIAVMRKAGVIRLKDYAARSANDEGEIDLSSPAPTQPMSMMFGLAWDVTNGVNIDLDASAICLDEHLNAVDIVYYHQLKSKDGAIIHHGDEREGDETGDDEKITIHLDHRINPAVQYIGIVINSYSGQELDDVQRAACHLFDQRSRRDIATYTLTNSSELDGFTALVVGCLYKQSGDWLFRVIAEPAMGRTAHDNVDELQNFLRRNPPQEPDIILQNGPDEGEIDLSGPAWNMPPTVPMVEEEEIVLGPM